MKTSKKEYRINVKNLVYAVVVSDTKDAVKYGEIKPFGSARQIRVSPTIAQGDLYGDGAKEKSMNKITGYDVQVDVNKVFVEVRAEILGNKITADGVLVDGGDDQPKEIALGYEIEQTGKTSEYVWLLKGTPQPFGNDVQQTEQNINYSTDSLKISFVKRAYDGQFRAIGDTAYEGFSAEKAAEFLKTVPTEFNYSEETENVEQTSATEEE